MDKIEEEQIEKNFHHAFKCLIDHQIDPSLNVFNKEFIHQNYQLFREFWLRIEFNRLPRGEFINYFIAEKMKNKNHPDLKFYSRKFYMLYDIHKIIYVVNKGNF